jgi:hypothetical protein
VPDGCERILAEVGKPAVNEGDDARMSTARHRAALAAANRRL